MRRQVAPIPRPALRPRAHARREASAASACRARQVRTAAARSPHDGVCPAGPSAAASSGPPTPPSCGSWSRAATSAWPTPPCAAPAPASPSATACTSRVGGWVGGKAEEWGAWEGAAWRAAGQRGLQGGGTGRSVLRETQWVQDAGGHALRSPSRVRCRHGVPPAARLAGLTAVPRPWHPPAHGPGLPCRALVPTQHPHP